VHQVLAASSKQQRHWPLFEELVVSPDHTASQYQIHWPELEALVVSLVEDAPSLVTHLYAALLLAPLVSCSLGNEETVCEVYLDDETEQRRMHASHSSWRNPLRPESLAQTEVWVVSEVWWV
jgi:hypothetical protein